MQSIIDFLASIGETIINGIDFVISFFSDIIYIILLTSQVFASLPLYFSWLPAEAVTILILIFSIVMIYKITGREG